MYVTLTTLYETNQYKVTMMALDGLELTTHCLQVRPSTHLSMPPLLFFQSL